MKEDGDVPIIIVQPQLNTVSGLVDIRESKLTLQMGKEEITFGIDERSKYSNAQVSVFFMDG